MQFCDFNSKPEDVCKVISELESVGENYDSFGKHHAHMHSICRDECERNVVINNYYAFSINFTETASLYSIM